MKFRNLRRSERSETAGIELDHVVSKKVKIDLTEPSASDIQVYERHLKRMKDDYVNGRWSVTALSTLLEETYSIRRWYIETEVPTVKEVLDIYPCLCEPELVRLYCN